MNTTLSDAALVTAHLAGDRTALAAIYDRYSSGLYDTAAAMLSDRHDAADMVQDVFCIAAERLAQLRDPERLKPWLYAVLRNEVYRRTKRRRRATPTDFQSETVPDVVAPTDPSAEGASVAFAELASLVRAAAAGLDERDQLILELSVRQGLEGADLADALGVSPEQSYSMVHRMRERVDRSLGAFVVAKAGRRECATLDEILRDWDGRFNVLIRKRVARHIESCETCEETKGKVAPLALFGAAPVMAAPLGLRERVLSAASRVPVSGSGGAADGSSSRIRWRKSDGFPGAGRVSRTITWWGASAVVLVVAGSVAVLTTGAEDGPASSEPITNPVPTTTPSESATTTSITTPSEPVTTTSTTTAPTPTSKPVASPSSITPVAPVTTIAPVVSPVAATTTVVSKVSTTTGAPRATTTAPRATSTTTPRPTTTTPTLRGLALDVTAVDFSTSSTTANVRLTNPNSRAVPWKIASTQPSFFSFDSSSGNLAAGASTTIKITFARASASSYTNASVFPEGRFTFAARVTVTGAPATAFDLLGAVRRPPQLGTITVRFNGNGCANLSLQVPVTDESALKSVTATLTLTGSSASSTRTVTLTDSGKGSWVGASTDIPASVTAVSVSVTATDRPGLSATAGTKIARPSSC